MRVNEIKRTVEEVIRVEYIAEDGQVFKSEEECSKYEQSALFVVSSKLKKLNTKFINIADLLDEGSTENEVEIFDVQTSEDLENLRKYLYLKARKHGATENNIEEAFTSKDGTRTEYVFDSVTVGHEVIIFWNYEQDWFWVYRDGSIEGYLDYLRDRITKLIAPKNTKNLEDK